MSAFVKSLYDPLAVEHAVALKLRSADCHDLVVSKQGCIQLFELVEQQNPETVEVPEAAEPESAEVVDLQADQEQAFLGTDVQFERTQDTRSRQLHLVTQTNVFGHVESLCKISQPHKPDLLMVGSLNAKVSIVEWSHETQSFVTRSLHYFENVDYESSHLADKTCCRLMVDPHQQCATVRIYRDLLAFIPLQTSSNDPLLTEEPISDEQSNAKPSSFVLPVGQLDESIANVVDAVYLHGFREPTLAILYMPFESHTALQPLRKSHACLKLINLDLEEKASTVIVSIPNLPITIHSLLELPEPVGGLLAIGDNEFLYIDPNGRTIGASTNSDGRSSEINLEDYSELCIGLEGSDTSLLNLTSSSAIFVCITRNGRLLQVVLHLEGKSVKALRILELESRNRRFLQNGASCVVSLPDRALFVGSRTCNSALLEWSMARKAQGTDSGHGFQAQDKVDGDGLLDNDLDELYGDQSDGLRDDSRTAPTTVQLKLLDSLYNHGPVRDVALGRRIQAADFHTGNSEFDDVELVTVTGTAELGSLTLFKKSLPRDEVAAFDFPGSKGIWTLRQRSRRVDPHTRKPRFIPDEDVDTYLLVTRPNESLIFTLGTSFDEISHSDFDIRGPTVQAGSVLDETCFVQVRKRDVRLYDSDLNYIRALSPPDSPSRVSIVDAEISGDKILLFYSHGSFDLFNVSAERKFVKHTLPSDIINSNISYAHLSEIPLGCFATSQQPTTEVASSRGTKRKRPGRGADTSAAEEITETNVSEIKGNIQAKESLLFVLDEQSNLRITHLGSGQQLHIPGIARFETLMRSETDASGEYDIKDPISSMIATQFGHEQGETYLVFHTQSQEVIVYRCFGGLEDFCLVKVDNQSFLHHVEHNGDTSNQKIRMPHTGGMKELNYRTGATGVFIPGERARWIVKTRHSLPHIHNSSERQGILSASPFNSRSCQDGVIAVTSHETVTITKTPAEVVLEGKMVTSQVRLNSQGHAIAFQPVANVYAVGTSNEQQFVLKDEEGNEAYPIDDPTTIKPTIGQGMVRLFSPLTWTEIDAYQLDECEVPVKIIDAYLEVNDETKVRKHYIVVGSAIMKGEDVAMRGMVYVFEIIEVNPEIGKPETRHKLRLVTRENVRGAISDICDIEGYLLNVQGLKALIRGIEDEDHLVPVAFHDLGIYTTVAKSLRNLLLFGDSNRSVELCGFAEEPYRVTLFARDVHELKVATADFAIDRHELYIVVVDDSDTIHLFKYDPENPQSSGGERLVKRAEYHHGRIATCTAMIPRYNAIAGTESENEAQTLCLIADAAGGLSAVVPLSDQSYRHLNVIQGQIHNRRIPFGGLHSRAFRTPSYFNAAPRPLRAIVDGTILGEFANTSTAAKTDLTRRANTSVAKVMQDLMALENCVDYL